MPKPAKVIKVLLYCVLILYAPILIVAVFLYWPSGKIVAQWQQPAEIEYDGRGPYNVTIVEKDRNWYLFMLSTDWNYDIYVGRESPPSYGHWIKYPFAEDEDKISAKLSQATVEWTDDGVTLELATGHRIFVPKKSFIGGR